MVVAVVTDNNNNNTFNLEAPFKTPKVTIMFCSSCGMEPLKSERLCVLSISSNACLLYFSSGWHAGKVKVEKAKYTQKRRKTRDSTAERTNTSASGGAMVTASKCT